MKLGIVGDLHFGVQKGSEVFLESQKRFFVFLKQYCDDNKIDTIIFLGDIFDNRQSIDIQVYSFVLECFEEILVGIRKICLIGNHDLYYTNSLEIHSLKMLSGINDIEIIDSPITLQFDDISCDIFPWIIDNSSFSPLTKESKYCFGHFDIKGFMYNKGIFSEEGLNVSDLISYEKIFSGHYHISQHRKVSQSDFYYVGTPYHLDRGDIGEDKSIIILDTDTDSIEKVSCPHTVMFKEYAYPNLPDTNQEVEGHFVDVVVDSDKIDDAFEKYIEEISKLKPNGKINIKVKEIQKDEDVSAFKEFCENIVGELSLKDMMGAFIRNHPSYSKKEYMLNEVSDLWKTL